MSVWVWRTSGALIIVILTIVISRLVSGRVRRGLTRTSLGPNPTLLIARVARAVVYFIGLLWILAVFSVPFTALAAVVSVTALALSLSLQDLLKNLIAGLYLLAERPFHIGDRITVSGVTGTIDDIEMRATYLRTSEGERVIMPNQTVFTQVIVNNTVAGGRMQSLTVEFPRSMRADEIHRLLTTSLKNMSTSQPKSEPRIEPVGATPDVTRWRVTVWLPDGDRPGDVIAQIIEAAPSASIEVAE